MAKSAMMLDKLAPSAKILDGVLILTLPDAQRPVVWQMELGQTKASAMEVREQDDAFILVLKTPRQDVVEIAPYDSRDKAVRALLAISKALESAQGQLRPNAANSNQFLPAVIPQSEPGRSKLARIAIGAVILAALIFAFTQIKTPQPAADISPAAGTTAPAASATGEPLSADDYLNSQ